MQITEHYYMHINNTPPTVFFKNCSYISLHVKAATGAWQGALLTAVSSVMGKSAGDLRSLLLHSVFLQLTTLLQHGRIQTQLSVKNINARSEGRKNIPWSLTPAKVMQYILGIGLLF